MAKTSHPKQRKPQTGVLSAAAGQREAYSYRGPQFGEATPTQDPTQYTVKHGSDNAAYSILDKQKGKLQPRQFPVVKGVDEPILQLADAFGSKGAGIVAQLKPPAKLFFTA